MQSDLQQINLQSQPATSASGIISETVKVTPAMAASWLHSNSSNRPLRRTHVQFLAAQMKEGHWVLNGAPIIFVGRQLMDGQHRLNAVIRSGCTVSMLVVKLPSSSASAKHVFDTIDQNITRGSADVLAIHNEANYKLLATLLKLIANFDHAVSQTNPKTRKFTNAYGRVRMPNRQIVALLEKYPTARASASFASGKAKNAHLLTRSHWAFFHYVLSRIDADDALAFLTKLQTGANLTPKDPALVLREKLISMQRDLNSVSSRQLPKTSLVMSLVFQSWNAFRDGKPLAILRYREDAEIPLPY